MAARHLYYRIRPGPFMGIVSKERDPEYLESLRNELDRARIVEPTGLSDDVVTMNSRVRLKDIWRPERKEQNLDLAPIGTVVLGYRAGDTQWTGSAGWKGRHSGDLYQPEAVGRYDQ